MKTNNAERYWTAEELLEGVKEAPAWERKGYRYMVKCDETVYFASTKHQLSKIVASVYSTAPRTYRNADKGITIDFDHR